MNANDKNKTESVEVERVEEIPEGEPKALVLPKIISFDTLSRCGDEVWIENNGQIYFLRRTKQGKLILTK